MSNHKTPESQRLIKLVEAAPFSPEEKAGWSAKLHEEGITTELAETIHKGLAALPVEKFASEWQKAKFTMDLTALLNQWRMSQGSKNFKHNR